VFDGRPSLSVLCFYTAIRSHILYYILPGNLLTFHIIGFIASAAEPFSVQDFQQFFSAALVRFAVVLSTVPDVAHKTGNCILFFCLWSREKNILLKPSWERLLDMASLKRQVKYGR